MIRLKRPTIWQTSAPRAVAEGLIAALMFMVAVMLVANELPDSTVRSGFFFSAVIAGTISGFRVRPSDAGFLRRTRRSMIIALTLATLLPLSTWLLGVIFGQGNFLERSGLWVVLSIFLLSGNALVYLSWRLFGIAWRKWVELRRTRFAWSLTAAFTNIIIAFVFCVMAISFIYTFFRIFQDLATLDNASWVARILRDLALSVFPQLILFWLALIAALIVTIPPVLLFFYLSTRRLTLRIEALASATRQLHEGDLSARITVSGSDEVAQLQTAFNQMAESLQITTQALQTERDKVTALLKTQREFTATISHELRTPVAVIHAYLENNLSNNKVLPPALQNDLEIMEHETEQMQIMVDDLFTIAQSEVNQLNLKLQAMDLVPFLTAWVEKYKPIAWKNHKVELQFVSQTDTFNIQADPQRLEQIISNLVQNAVRHTPPGGIVQVEMTHAKDKTSIGVRDTGEGIPAEDLEFVWQRYYRGKKNEHQGSGLGLALVKELAGSMGAVVGVESEPGEGSHFWVEWQAGG